jgi:hypothetical protein
MLRSVVVLRNAKVELRVRSASVHARYDVACYRLQMVGWREVVEEETTKRGTQSMRLNGSAETVADMAQRVVELGNAMASDPRLGVRVTLPAAASPHCWIAR